MTDLEKRLYDLEEANLNALCEETLENSIGKARAKDTAKSFGHVPSNVKVALILEHNPNYHFVERIGWIEK